MREIKFQAWLGHAMVQVVKLDFMLNAAGDEYINIGVGYFLDGEHKGTPIGFEMSKVKLREYTGLHDKNGREIYEGDIIVDGSVPGPEYGIGGYMFTKYEVKMVNGCFVVECIPDCVNDHVFGNYHLLYEVIADGFAEVVGNIYENPELLEVKTNNHKTV